MSVPVQQASHSFSKTWISPNISGNKQQERAKASRIRFCKKSEAWTKDMNREQHRVDFERECEDRKEKQAHREYNKQKGQRAIREQYGIPVTTSPRPGSLLANKIESAVSDPMQNLDLVPAFYNNFSTVLCLPTAFSRGYSINRLDPNWAEGGTPKPEPRFPGIAEKQYEGDGRIATDMLHRRFLGAPRVPGNDTVNWSQASIIPQYPLDDTRLYHDIALRGMPNAHEGIVVEELMFRSYEWDGRPCAGQPAVTDEGVHLLDADLLAYLDD